MERNIRDVRDIFGQFDNSDASRRKPELRSYEYSPRSRRKFEAMEDYDYRAPPPQSHHDPRTTTNSNHHHGGGNNNNKKSNRHRQDPDHPERLKKPDDHPKSNNSRSKDSAYYANRTLTERDIKHLERHLSMKKTIRKQISRNLAQAFVDDPELVLTDSAPAKSTSANSKTPATTTFTLTRAKVSKSEQNVLDLLKDNEPDSGHCSADNPNSSDDDSQEQTRQQQRHRNEKAGGNSRSLAENRSSNKLVDSPPYKEDGKFSFWKMFSVKSKGKR